MKAPRGRNICQKNSPVFLMSTMRMRRTEYAWSELNHCSATAGIADDADGEAAAAALLYKSLMAVT